jgi:hypothetical protein
MKTFSSLLAGIVLAAMSLTAGAEPDNSTAWTGASNATVQPRMTPAQYEAATASCDSRRGIARQACLNDVRAAYAGESVPDESMNPGRGPLNDRQGAD